MPADAVLITHPNVDFEQLVGISHQALGYSIVAASDSDPRRKNSTERFLSCLASMSDRDSTIISPNLFNHVSFSVLIACDDRDLIEVMECAAGIAFITTPTTQRDIALAVASGTLSQWKDAVISGSLRRNVRHLFNIIQGQFESKGMNAWGAYDKKHVGREYYLEHKC